MAFAFLDEENLGDKYQDAKDYTEKLTAPFPEFERIANNQPSDQRDKRYSDVTDGTTSSMVRKRGKRVVQQIPTGAVESDNEDDWLPIVTGFIFINKILPYANLDFDFIQKCWQIIEGGEKFGGVPTYVPFVNHDGYYCTDLSLPYWADVFIPEGYKSGNSCPYIFIRTWWQTEDIEAQIAEEKRLKKEDPSYEPTWDIEGLESVKDDYTKKENDEQTPSERDRGTNPEGIEIVTGFQVGNKGVFYTFCPSQDDKGKNEVTIVRRKTNKDPRGKMPIPWYYADNDGFNPMGRSTVELVGPLQNLIDSDMQMYQWNRALMLAPPLVAYGSVDKKKVVYSPNAIIPIKDPNAKIEALNVDSTAVAQYPSLYGLQKSQLLNLVASPDTSISAEVGNPGFSKTDAGVKAQSANISVDDNYIRKNFEAWFENWAETAINLYFAERTGKDVIQLDKETVAQLQKLADAGKFDMNMVNENNQILIDYDTATPALKFRVDASTSKMKDDTTQGEIITQLLDTVQSSPLLSQIVPQDKILAAWNAIVSNSGVENPEDLRVDLEEFKKQQEAAMQQQQAMAEQAAAAQATAQPIEGEVVQPNPEDEQIASELQQMGVPDELIAQAIDMLDKGYGAEDVLTAIQGVMADV